MLRKLPFSCTFGGGESPERRFRSYIPEHGIQPVIKPAQQCSRYGEIPSFGFVSCLPHIFILPAFFFFCLAFPLHRCSWCHNCRSKHPRFKCRYNFLYSYFTIIRLGCVWYIGTIYENKKNDGPSLSPGLKFLLQNKFSLVAGCIPTLTLNYIS